MLYAAWLQSAESLSLGWVVVWSEVWVLPRFPTLAVSLLFVFVLRCFSQRMLWFLLPCWKLCVGEKFPVTFQSLYSFSSRALSHENGLVLFNELTDDQKYPMKNLLEVWQPMFSLPLVRDSVSPGTALGCPWGLGLERHKRGKLMLWRSRKRN